MKHEFSKNQFMVNEADLSNVSGGAECAAEPLTIPGDIQYVLPVLNTFNEVQVFPKEQEKMDQQDTPMSPKARGI